MTLCRSIGRLAFTPSPELLRHPSLVGDISRLVAEREKLMEISNMLRADLNKVLSESYVAPSAAAAVERAEREVASRCGRKYRK